MQRHENRGMVVNCGCEFHLYIQYSNAGIYSLTYISMNNIHILSSCFCSSSGNKSNNSKNFYNFFIFNVFQVFLNNFIDVLNPIKYKYWLLIQIHVLKMIFVNKQLNDFYGITVIQPFAKLRIKCAQCAFYCVSIGLEKFIFWMTHLGNRISRNIAIFTCWFLIE